MKNQEEFLNYVSRIQIHRWLMKVRLIINQEHLLGTGADVNCVQEGLIPIQYYEKSIERLYSANIQN